MHMADALISPTVGGAAWAVSAGLIGFSSRQLKRSLDEKRIPLMAVMGAFVFAAQMINFTIPGTGSSGHLGGGLLLAVLLGPSAGFLVISSVLTIQALFFADGGLLALGCNILNLGLWPCFVAYPLIYRMIAGSSPTRGRILTASIAAAAAGLQMGAFSVVLQTFLSGISALPFGTFVTLMQPIHLAIGLVEGLATASVVLFVHKARPELVTASYPPATTPALSSKWLVTAFLTASILIGGGMSWFASTHPDGLEWSMEKTSGAEKVNSPAGGVHGSLAELQERTAVLPDYGFKKPGDEGSSSPVLPGVDTGTSIAGIVGGILTLFCVTVMGFALRRRDPKFKNPDSK